MSLSDKIRAGLGKLSFSVGIVILLSCIPFYILSFAQMALPISNYAKGALWVLLFGMAKACQYAGITIVGVEGFKRLKQKFRLSKAYPER